MVAVTTAMVSWYVADKLIAQFIKEEGYNKWKKFWFPEKTYKMRLQELIEATIKEYKQLSDTKFTSGKIPFYESQIGFETLNAHILFKSNIPFTVEAFTTNTNIATPTQQDLDEFYDIFINKVANDKELKKLHFNQNYKDEIYNVSTKLDGIREAVTQILDTVKTFQGEANDKLSLIIAKLDFNKEAADLSSIIENISSLRASNKHAAVIELLQKFKKENWENLSPEIKWKIQINLGQTYFELDDYKNASEYFIDLPTYNHKLLDSNALAALGYAFIGNKDKATNLANQVLSQDSGSVNAQLAIIFVTPDESVDEIVSAIPEANRQKPEIAFSIAGKYLRQNRLEEAASYFEDVLKNLKDESLFKIEVLYLLATAKYNSLHIESANDLTPAILDSLESLLKMYTKVWEYYKDTDLRKSNWHVLSNIAIINKLLGNTDKAEANLYESLEIKKTFFSYLNLLLLKHDDKVVKDRLIKEMEALELSADELCQVTIIKAESLLHDSRAEDAKSLLVAHIQQFTDSSHYVFYVSLLIDCLIELGDIQQASTYAHLLVAKRPQHFQSKFYGIKLKIIQGENENINVDLSVLKDSLNEQSTTEQYLKTADLFLDIGNEKAAAEVLEKVASHGIYNFISKRLLQIYYSLGNYEKAIPMAEALRNSHRADPFLADYLSAIYEILTEYDKAIAIITDFLSLIPNDSVFKTKLSINYCKKGDFEMGSATLSSIDEIEKLPVDVQFFIANAYLENGEYIKGMEIAYKLRQRKYSDATIHERYLMLAAQPKNNIPDNYFPSKVESNTYVVLLDEKKNQTTYIITNEPIANNEISEGEPIAQKLLGKSIGETVLIGDQPYEIVSILPKYTFAFQDSMVQISTRFADQQLSVKVFNVVDKGGQYDFKPIFDVIDQSDNVRKEVDKLYATRTATIGSNSTLLNENPIRYWSKLSASADIGIYSIGPREEYGDAIEKLENAVGVVLDITALLTLFHLNAMNVLKKISNNVYVLRTTIALVEEEIASLEENIEEETFTVNKAGEQYIKTIVTPDQKKAFVSRFRQLLAEIKDCCQIVNPVLSNDHKEKKKVDKVLGESFNDTALYAESNKILLFSDDLNYRSVARSKFSTNGLCTFIFLQFLLQSEMITPGEYEGFMVSIVKLNYRLVPLTPKILYRLFLDSKLRIEQPFINGCDILRPDILPDILAARFCVDFLYMIYTQLSTFNRTFVCQFILQRFFQGRNYINARSILIELLNTKFFLLPEQKIEILRLMH